MNRKVFKRSVIEENSFLEGALAPKLKERKANLIQTLRALRDIQSDADRNSAKKRVERAFMDLVLEEFRFAQKLGIDLELNKDGGSGGARYARDRCGRRILVVKPGDEGPHGVNNPQWYAHIKRLLLSPKACLEGNSEPMAEVDSWRWDRDFDIWSVPPTDIRHVASQTFVGHTYKECSVQMFVKGCKTLGKYIGVSPTIHWLPRCFQRWYCGSRFDTGPLLYAIGQRGDRKKELLDKVPHRLLERVAIHNMGIEDIDCHFENILVKVAEVGAQQSVLDRIFEGDQTVSDGEIEKCIRSFFKSKENQALITHLLSSEVVSVDVEREEEKKTVTQRVTLIKEGVEKYARNFFTSKENQALGTSPLSSEVVSVDMEREEEKKTVTQRVTLIKHDGGSSNPKSHPSTWDFLSLRFKHLFEVLPHFEEPFSLEGKSLIVGKEETVARLLLEKGTRYLRNTMKPELFKNFWSLEENRSNLKKWIFATVEKDKDELRLLLLDGIFKATNKGPKKCHKVWDYFDPHLARIRGNLQTRIDSFRVLKKFLSEDDAMRTLFKNVTTKSDFKRELKDLSDNFDGVMEKWKLSLVKKGRVTLDGFLHTSLEATHLFEDLGVGEELR